MDVRTVNEHLGNIYAGNELSHEATVRKIRIVQQEGSRSVSRELDFYNLDAIIAVGYRVNSYQATQFRIWATNTLKEFIIKGFVLDDERLKQGGKFGKDYFDELLERIREFFNVGLGTDEDCHQISVSINTDEQGIFHTSIENEFALMGLSLEKNLQPDGRTPRFNPHAIYTWLDNVRELAFEQQF